MRVEDQEATCSPLAGAQLIVSRVTLCEVLTRAAVTRAYGLALARGGRHGQHIPRAVSCAFVLPPRAQVTPSPSRSPVFTSGPERHPTGRDCVV